MLFQRPTVLQVMQAYAQANSIQYTSYFDLIEKTKEYIFDFDYPLPTKSVFEKYENFDKGYKYILETSILMQYINNRIFTEDVEMFKLKLRNWLVVNMPYYNYMLESETWPYTYIENPANNTDYKETYTRTIDNSSNSVTNGSNNFNSDTSNTSNVSGTTKSNNSTETDSMSTSSNEQTSKNTSETNATNTTNSENTNFPITGNGSASSLIAGDVLTNTLAVQTDYNFTHPTDAGYSNVGMNSKDNSSNSTNSDTTENSNISSKTKDDSTTTTSSDDSSKSTSTSKTTSEYDSTGNSQEVYEFHRIGNIGIQTPGQVFESTRLAMINTTKAIINGTELPGQKYYQKGREKLTNLFASDYIEDMYDFLY